MSGGLLEDPKKIRSDAAIIQQSVTGKWHISEEDRKKLMDKALKLSFDEKTRTREFNALAKTIALLDRVALAAEIAQRDNKPQVVVVNNNSNSIDTLSVAAAGIKDPADAQKFLEILGKSEYQPADNADAPKPAQANTGSAGRS